MAAVDEASTSSQTLIAEGPEPSDSGRLNPKHKIFLSHSGTDKNFVRHLYENLARVHHYAFFDVSDDSLPKGKEFPQLIFQAARQCQLAIVVVSDNFFMSKWPMLELASFVEAQNANNPDLKILPLFYGLAAAQFREPERQDRWFKEWEKLAGSDTSGRIFTFKWKAALEVVGRSNGLQFADYGKIDVEYIKEIVKSTCGLVPVDVRWNESHIQGREHLHSAVRQMFEKSVLSVNVGCRVVGLYGMGGTGKTTLCKTLCNGFFADFVGKVCHLEIGCKTKTPIESQKEVLQELTGASDELLKKVTDFDKGQNLYVERIGRQKIFLTLDNVWDSPEPLAEAAAYLQAQYTSDSKILVTARSLDTLHKLGINQDSCFEMPHLEEKDAMALFLHYAQPNRSLSDFKDPDELQVLKRCVSFALLGKGMASKDTSENVFHPLALKVLGLHFVTTSPKFLLAWIEKLDQLDMKGYEEIGDPIFSVLRTSYDALPNERTRSMFLDAAIYAPRKPDNTAPTVKQLCKWLSTVYEEDFKDVLASLEVLSSRALLDHWHNLSEVVSIHDLYREFAESRGGGNEDDQVRLFHQGGDTVPKLLRKNPVRSNCLPFERICIRNVGTKSFDKAKLGSCSNLEVLKLDFCPELRSLSLQGLKELRSLELYGCLELKNVLHVTELESLVWMRWNTCNSLYLVFSTSLQILELFGVSKEFSVEDPPGIQGCKLLREITLTNFPVLSSFPEVSGLTRLVTVDFSGCIMVGFLDLSHQYCLQKINLQNCKSLESLRLPPACPALMKIKCRGCECLVDLGNIADCRNLRVLDLEGCRMLTSQLAKIRSFNTLTHLKLSNCTRLEGLPDLSNSMELQELEVTGCDALPQLGELHEEGFPEQFASRPVFRMVGCQGLTIIFLMDFLKPGIPLPNQLFALKTLGKFIRSADSGRCWSAVPDCEYLLSLLKSEPHKYHVADLLSKLCWVLSPEYSLRYGQFREYSREVHGLTKALTNYGPNTFHVQSIFGNFRNIVTVIDALCVDENLGSLSFVIAAIAGFEEAGNTWECNSSSSIVSEKLTCALLEERPMLRQGGVELLGEQMMKHFRDKYRDSPRKVLSALCALADNIHIGDNLHLQSMEWLQIKKQLRFEVEFEAELDAQLNRHIVSDSGRLNPKHKIFLSHSGTDKNFVRHLYENLARVHHYAFFDVSDDSLPKGKEFPQLIFQAARQCQLAIVVVSDNFFMSKWPMLELASFVEAQNANNPDLKILPLFYGLAAAQFREPERQDRWFKEWEKLAGSDTSGRIFTFKWKAALEVVGRSNGLQFADYGKNEVEYIKEIVKSTCGLVPVDMRWNESHIHGREHLHSAVRQMFEKSVLSVNVGCRVVGLYGMGGTGKTTLCKTLCNGFFADFVGKVCHLEIRCKTKTPIESQKEVLQELTGASDELLKKVTDFDKGQNLYVERIGRQKIFLTLDNVWDSPEPLAEAAAYLQAQFTTDSKILVTARSLDTLHKLGINQDSCFEMPHLEEKDAMALFLHYAQPNRPLSDFKDPDELQVLKRCVSFTLLGKGMASKDTSENVFHPLALKVLGLHFVTTSPKFLLAWIEKLDQLDMKGYEEIGDPIFSVLRTSYDALPNERTRSMFLDAAIYAPRKPDNTAPTVKQLCKWLSTVYEEDFKDVLASLEVLSSRALLDHCNLSEVVSIHDLYREFAESRGGGNEVDQVRLFHQGGDTVPKLLRKNPVRSNCLPFERICIRNVGTKSFDKAKLGSCSNLEVLKLDFCPELRSLSLQGLKELRSLELYGCLELKNVLHVTELESLVWMRWNTCNSLGQDLVFSTSLEILELFGVSKESSVDRPPNIQGCKLLREITLTNFPALLSFPEVSGRLVKVDFSGCIRVGFLDLFHQNCLQKINLQNCKGLCMLVLPLACPALMKIKCRGCERLVELGNIVFCRNLRVLDLEGCRMLTSQLAKIRSFNTLTHLKLSNCTRLEGLPDLSSSMELQELEVTGCDALPQLGELHEEGFPEQFASRPVFKMVGCQGLTIIFLMDFLKPGIPLPNQLFALKTLGKFIRSADSGCWSAVPDCEYLLSLLKSKPLKYHVADLLTRLCWVPIPVSKPGFHLCYGRSGDSTEVSRLTKALTNYGPDTFHVQSIFGNFRNIVTVIDALCMDENLGSLSFVIAAIAKAGRLTCALLEERLMLRQGGIELLAEQMMKHFRDKYRDSPRRVLSALCALADNIHIRDHLHVQDIEWLQIKQELLFEVEFEAELDAQLNRHIVR